MKRPMLLNLLGLFALLFTTEAMSLAQDKIAPEKIAKPDKQKVQIYRLMSIDPELASQVIKTLIDGKNCRIAVDAKSNSIIASGSEEDLNVIEALLARLDVNKKNNSAVIQLKHVSANEAAKTLTQQFNNSDSLNIVVESRQNALLVSGPDEMLKELYSLVEAIDTPVAKGQLAGKNVLIYSYWIVDKDQAQKQYPGWDLREVPDSITKLVREKLAKRTSIRNPIMATSIAIQAAVGESAKESNVIQNSGGGKVDEKNKYELKVHGNIWNDANGAAKVDIELQLGISLSEQGQSSRDSEVMTKIRTPLNHPVCLGMTPVNGVDSILVIEVVDAD